MTICNSSTIKITTCHFFHQRRRARGGRNVIFGGQSAICNTDQILGPEASALLADGLDVRIEFIRQPGRVAAVNPVQRNAVVMAQLHRGLQGQQPPPSLELIVERLLYVGGCSEVPLILNSKCRARVPEASCDVLCQVACASGSIILPFAIAFPQQLGNWGIILLR